MDQKISQFLRKMKLWKEETETLRGIILETELEEDFKWNLPCYTFDGKNIAIIQPFKASLSMMFFKGSLLKDPKKVLVDNGPNSEITRRFEFRSAQDVLKLRAIIKAYIKEAIAIEKSGLKVEVKKKPHPVPTELLAFFAKKPTLKKAFTALTPGRQRAYNLFFTGAKQEKTRIARIEKCIPKILAGKGLHD